MGLCGSFRCGCGISSDGSISVSGSGEALDPFVLSVDALLGYDELTGTTQTSITAEADLNGLTLSFYAVGSRMYRISGQIRVQSSVTGDTAALIIANQYNAQIAVQNSGPLTAGVEQGIPISMITTYETGSQVAKLRLARASGSGILTVWSHNYGRSWISVEDIGSV